MKNYILEHFDEALKNQWIKVYYQPVVRTLTGGFCGAEVLSRWQDPEKGMLSPGEFIPTLEESGRIIDLDLYVLERICQDYQLHVEQGFEIVPVSFNLSRKDLLHDDIVERIESIMARYDVPRELVNVEITESAFIEEVRRIGPVVDRLHQLGYQVWMDDFGSGFSSLGILKDYFFDGIKIDMSFLSHFDDRAKSIIRSVVNLAKQIGVQTLAEGVETEEQVEFLRQIGCEKIQGFYYGRPMPLQEMFVYRRRMGYGTESMEWQNYYDKISAINYQTDVPLMVVDDYDQTFHILYSNDKYNAELLQDGVDSAAQWETMLNDPQDTMHRFHRMLVEQKIRELGKEYIVTYPRGDHYMELKAKAIAAHGGHVAYQAELRYIAIEVKTQDNDELDEYLRNTYYIYQDMVLVDLEKDEVVSLKSSLAEQPIGREKVTKGAQRVMDAYRDLLVYPADWEAYDAFFHIDTLEQRIRESKKGMISGYFRYKHHGEYHWGHYINMIEPHSGKHKVLMLLVQSDMDSVALSALLGRREEWVNEGKRALQQKRSDAEILWSNFRMMFPVMCFWKDKQRRFIGASNSFLKYYGIRSLDELVGKTDEEMNWHVNAGPFRKDEWDVLNEGKRIIGVRGTCIARGRLRHIQAYKIPVYEEGKIIGLMGMFVDLDQMENDKENYMEASMQDPATGLDNLRGLSENMGRYLEEFWHHGVRFCVMGFFLREYESFRKTYGDAAGDIYLKAAGDVLKAVFDNRAIIGHALNGQFYVLMQYKNQEDMRYLQNAAVRRIAAIRHIGEQRCTITAIPTLAFVNEKNGSELRYERMMYQFMKELGKEG